MLAMNISQNVVCSESCYYRVTSQGCRTESDRLQNKQKVGTDESFSSDMLEHAVLDPILW
jgi:hypothetical protein